MIDVLGVALNMDLQGFSREEGSDELPPGLAKTSPPSTAQYPPRPQSTPSSSTSNSKPNPPPPAPEPEKEDVEMSEEDAEEAKAKAEALAEKEKGSEHYKQRRFDEAAAAFSKAWDLWPKDITFLTNLGAVYFEQGEYDKCIETCEKAVEEGRSVRCHSLGNTESVVLMHVTVPCRLQASRKSSRTYRLSLFAKGRLCFFQKVLPKVAC